MSGDGVKYLNLIGSLLTFTTELDFTDEEMKKIEEAHDILLKLWIENK